MMLTEKITAKHGFFIVMSFWGYIVLAFPTTIHGSLAPVTMEFYGISAAQQGLIMTMHAAGMLGTALFIGLKGESFNKIHAIAFGLVVVGIMGAAISSAPIFAVLLVMAVVLGFGNTFIDVMMNGVMSDVYPSRQTTLLPLVHGFFMVGAMLVPAVVTALASPEQPDSFVRPFHVLFILALTVAALYFISGRGIMKETPYTDMSAMKKRVAENPAEIFKTKEAWFFIVVGFLYFSFQMGTAMWLPTFAIRNAGADYMTGGLMLSMFFAGNLVMRLVSPLFFKKFTSRVIYSVFGFISGAFMVAALIADSIPLMFVLIGLAGFTQGAMVAAFILLCIGAFPGRTASASSITTISSGTATLTAPFWMGALSAYTDGFLVPMLMICVCLFAASALIFIKK